MFKFKKTKKALKEIFQKNPEKIKKAQELFENWEKNPSSIENISNIYEHRKKSRLSLKDFTKNSIFQKELKVALQTYAIITDKGGVSKNTQKKLQKKIGIAA
jgi:tRNA A37 N6-isopentenylltransferase MiaA